MKYLTVFFLSLFAKANQPSFYMDAYGNKIVPCSIPIVLDTSQSNELTKKSVEYAAKKWNDSINKTLFVIGNSRNKVINTTNWKRYRNEQAITSSDFRGNCLTSSTITINNEDFIYYTGSSYKNEYNLDALMIHELGHVLGLDHDENKMSVMYEHLDKREDRITIQQIDINKIKPEYNKGN
jgi:predicted Zn-dependent protease